MYSKNHVEVYKFVESDQYSCNACHLYEKDACVQANCRNGYFIKLSKIDQEIEKKTEEAMEYLSKMPDDEGALFPQTGKEVFKSRVLKDKSTGEDLFHPSDLSLGRRNEYNKEMAARYAKRRYEEWV